MGRKLGDPGDPLLVSVRSGAKFSMPGMMETVLNIGLSDESVLGLAKQSGNERFAWDAYRRLIQMFGKTVLGIDGEHFEHALDGAKQAKGVASDTQLTAEDLKALTSDLQGDRRRARRARLPAGPARADGPRDARRCSSRGTPTARSCTAARSASPRTSARPSTWWRWSSATWATTRAPAWRSPATRAPARRASTATTCRTRRARTWWPASATRCRCRTWSGIDKASYDQLMEIMRTLENHYRDLCDIEFTIERGKLWMLQTRVGKRTAAAAFRIAMQLVDQGMIDLDEALNRVTGDELARLMFPRFDASGDVTSDHQGDQRLAGRRRRQGGLRLGGRGRVGGPRRARHPGPPRDQPRRPARHDRRPGRAHQPRRQDQPRGGGRPRHGQDLRLRRRGARASTPAARSSPRQAASWSARAT